MAVAAVTTLVGVDAVWYGLDGSLLVFCVFLCNLIIFTMEFILLRFALYRPSFDFSVQFCKFNVQ